MGLFVTFLVLCLLASRPITIFIITTIEQTPATSAAFVAGALNFWAWISPRGLLLCLFFQ